jgi:hypothetical protein
MRNPDQTGRIYGKFGQKANQQKSPCLKYAIATGAKPVASGFLNYKKLYLCASFESKCNLFSYMPFAYHYFLKREHSFITQD